MLVSTCYWRLQGLPTLAGAAAGAAPAALGLGPADLLLLGIISIYLLTPIFGHT